LPFEARNDVKSNARFLLLAPQKKGINLPFLLPMSISGKKFFFVSLQITKIAPLKTEDIFSS
jgi:hypothetical protein